MKQEFSAVIQQHSNINGAYVEPPFDVETVFGAKRVKVKATFDGTEYRGSIVKMGGCYMLGMTQDIRKKIGKDFGDTVEVTVEKDEEERIVELPSQLAEAFEQNPEAKNTFEKLSYTGKREYVLWINDAKKEETRNSRIEKAIQLLNEGKKLR
jgi:Uncharacterized protein conserved in bacteria